MSKNPAKLPLNDSYYFPIISLFVLNCLTGEQIRPLLPVRQALKAFALRDSCV